MFWPAQSKNAIASASLLIALLFSSHPAKINKSAMVIHIIEESIFFIKTSDVDRKSYLLSNLLKMIFCQEITDDN